MPPRRALKSRASEVTVASVVNLNKYRKKKAKLEREKRAETNRRLHGRTKAERARDELQRRLLDAKVDGAHLERDKPAGTDEGD
jgi:Domain of unknown function (DUF4169)